MKLSEKETTANTTKLLKASVNGDRKSQELLYRVYYSYAMAVCLRYSNSKDEALDICNDGFLKVFLKGEKYDEKYPFKAWLKRIMINTAIDYNRKNQKHNFHENIENAYGVSINEENAHSKLNYEELLKMVFRLPDSYREVFNLYAIDGYSHDEISEKLNIPVGTSKSKLSRAREALRQMLGKINRELEHTINI